jgi:molecular chaperone DnaJ
VKLLGRFWNNKIMRMKRLTHYEVLGIRPDVTGAQIKSAYRQLVKDNHPDLSFGNDKKATHHTEVMIQINEAYAILSDTKKRSQYDQSIADAPKPKTRMPWATTDSLEEESQLEKYLKKVFHPNHRAITRVLKEYRPRLNKLSQDLYDEVELEEFTLYVEDLARTLKTASQEFSAHITPEAVKPALQWMRHAIAQAADGLEELNYFCNNYDYNHLAMADNLFKIAREHLRNAGASLKCSQE